MTFPPSWTKFTVDRPVGNLHVLTKEAIRQTRDIYATAVSPERAGSFVALIFQFIIVYMYEVSFCWG